MKGKFKKPIAFLMALALVFNMGFTAYAGAIPSNYNGNRFVAKAEDTGGGSEEQTVTDEVYGAPAASKVGLLAAPATPDYLADKVYLYGEDFTIGNSTNDQSVIPAFWIDASGDLLMAFSIHESKYPVTVKFNGDTSNDVVVYDADTQQTLTVTEGSESHSFIANDCDGGSNASHKWMVANFGNQDITGTFEVFADLGAGGHNIGDQGTVIIIMTDGEIRVEKVVHDSTGAVVTGDPTIFAINVTGPNNSSWTVNLAGGHSQTLTGLRYGNYYVSEPNPGDYSVSYSSPSILVDENDKTGEFVVTNQQNGHNLTIHYVYAGGGTAAPDYTASVSSGSTYSVPSPSITGYTPDIATVAGTMGTSDRVITVTYGINSYGLTIHYVYAGGGQAAPDYTDTLDYNEAYSVTSPLLTGYTADHLVVAGNMPASDVEVTVTYGINSYGLTIHYVYAGGGQAAPDYTDTLDYNEAYSVTSPLLTGYTADHLVVAGNMPASDVEVTVTYGINSYGLTIHYVYAGGGQAAPDYTDTLDYNEAYSVTSPLLTGYTADHLVVAGNMPASDVEVTVTYGINSYGLTIHYVYAGGGQAAPDYTDTLDYNEAYSVYSPYINGFTPDQWQVSGTMLAAPVVITVTYTANDYYVYYTGGDSDDDRTLMDKKNPYHYQNEVTVLANIDGVFVTTGDTPLDAPKFVKAGYHVIGWNQAYQYSPEAVSKAVVREVAVQYYPGDKIVMPSYNISLDAVWAPNTDTQYKIETYLQENGVYPSTATSSEVKNDGTTDAAKTITPGEIPGYTFDTKAGNVVEALIAADGSTVFKLYYKKIYTITYQAGDNGILTGGNQIHKLYYGDAYPTAPVPVANSHYVFAGWTPALPGVEATVTGDETFTAYFTSEATTSYTVYYYKKGTTTAVHSPKVVTGKEIGTTVEESAISVSGYDRVSPTTQTLTLKASGNVIYFYYIKESNPDPRPRPTPVKIIEEPIPLALNMVDHFQYLQGYPDNTVRPEGNITREEVAAVFYRLLMDDYRGTIMTYDENFPDVEANTWSTKYIATLTNGKILEGYEDGTFKPHNFITKAELAAVASRFDNLSPFEDDSFTDIAGHWANKYINSAAQKGWVKGNPDGTFKPDKYITRAEFATLVNNVLDRRVHKDKILETARKFPDLPSTKWYYEAMMEAINSHLFNRLEDGYEEWTEITKPDIEL